MKVLLLLSFVFLSVTAEPVPDPVSEDRIRGGIEEAAKDSADLAEELADLLAEFEEDEDEDEDSFDAVAAELEKTLEITEELSQASFRRKNKKNKQRPRKPKQFEEVELGSISDEDLFKALEEFDAEVEKSANLQKEKTSSSGSKSRDGKSYRGNKKSKTSKSVENNDKETCETEDQTNNVQVCTPDFQSKPQRLQFYGQETYQQEYCYEKSLTECPVTDETVDKEVCTYRYTQANHNVPATNVQITQETHSEKMIVTNCKHIKKDYGKVEEVCEIQYTSQHYDLPVVQEELLELIDLSYPEPEEDCSTFSVGIPEVSCSHSSDQFCVECNHIRDTRVTVEANQVVPSYRGNCDNRDLTLSQEMCTVERKVKVPAPRQPSYHQAAGYNAYQG